MKITSAKRLVFLGTLLVAITAVAASAETIKAVATRTQNDTATTTGIFKPLTQAGSTSVFFTTTATSALIKVTYNAECAVLGTPQAWLAVTVFIDGIEA